MSSAEIAAYIMVGLTFVFGVLFIIVLPLIRRDAVKKERQKHEDFVNNLKVGAKVVMIGGLYGTIVSINSVFAEIEIANNFIAKVDVDSIIAKQPK